MSLLHFLDSFGYQSPASTVKRLSSEQINRFVSLTKLIGRFLAIYPYKDDQAQCICPFHDDHDPSMLINEGPGYYYCFSCGTSGNHMTFLSHMLNISYESALLKTSFILCQNQSIDSWLDAVAPLPSTDLPILLSRSSSAIRHIPRITTFKPSVRPRDSLVGSRSLRLQGDEDVVSGEGGNSSHSSIFPTDHLERLHAILEKAAEYYSARLLMDPRATPVRKYLQSRYISLSTALKFRLGYASMPKILKATTTTPNATSATALSVEQSGKKGDVHPLTQLSAQQWKAMKALPLSPFLLTQSHDDTASGYGSSKAGNFTEAEVLAAGLAVNVSDGVGMGGWGVYDRFRNRLMVPILDMAGKVVGFGGRELPEEVTKQLSILCLGDKIGGLVSSKGEKEKKKAAGKYINSPSSPVFSKKHLLYGCHLPLSSASLHTTPPASQVLLVEGYFDVLSLHEGIWGPESFNANSDNSSVSGLKGVLATMGTSLSLEQVGGAARWALKGGGTMSRTTRSKSKGNPHEVLSPSRKQGRSDSSPRVVEVVLMLDNDCAGQVATERVAKLVLKHAQQQKTLANSTTTTLNPLAMASPRVFVKVKAVQWQEVISHILIERYALRAKPSARSTEERQEYFYDIPGVRGLKDGGDLLLLFKSPEIRKIVGFALQSAKEIGEFYMDL
eukprot:gene33504-40537_t